MALSWAFLLVVFVALCGMVIVIGVLAMLFRAATRSRGQGPEAGSSDPSNTAVPPVLTNDSLTHPASPLHPLHHSSPSMDDATRNISADTGSSAASPAPDPGSPSSSPDGGSGCG